MTRKILAILLLTALLPVSALAETTVLPYGLSLGLDPTATEACFAADAALADATYETLDDGDGTIEYVFEDVAIPNSDLTADSLSVQIDCNNSPKEQRLTMISFNLTTVNHTIADFRSLLTSMSETYGEPDSDPFDSDGVAQYVEWGTLSASWTKADVRISLSMSRMYDESVSILYSSRLNYDEADLAQQ